MNDEMKKAAIGLIKKAAESATEAAINLKEEYDKSDLKKNVESRLQETKVFLDENGVSERVSELKNYTTDQLDKFSGSKLVEVMNEKFDYQEKKMNTLSRKLDGALKRIKELEQKIKESELNESERKE